MRAEMSAIFFFFFEVKKTKKGGGGGVEGTYPSQSCRAKRGLGPRKNTKPSPIQFSISYYPF